MIWDRNEILYSRAASKFAFLDYTILGIQEDFDIARREIPERGRNPSCGTPQDAGCECAGSICFPGR